MRRSKKRVALQLQQTTSIAMITALLLQLTELLQLSMGALLLPNQQYQQHRQQQQYEQLPPRRCYTFMWNETRTIFSLDELHHQTVCETCEKSLSSTDERENSSCSGPHIVLLHLQELGEATLIELQVMAAGLLFANPNLRVSFVLFLGGIADSDEILSSSSASIELERAILAMLPCHVAVEAFGMSRLSVHVVQLDDDASAVLHPKCRLSVAMSTTPFDSCLLRNVNVQLAFLKSYISTNITIPIDVLVAHSNFVSATLLAETLSKSIVLLASSPKMLKYHVAYGGNGWLASSNSGNWFRNAYHILQDRWHKEIATTFTFMMMNRIRRAAGLAPMRVPSDYLVPISAVLVPSWPISVQANPTRNSLASSIIHRIGPLVPPCVCCGETSTSSCNDQLLFNTTAVILVLPLDQDRTCFTPSERRMVMRGLALARASLRSMSKHCQGDDDHCGAHVDLEVVWLHRHDEDRNVMLLLPSAFVTRETCFAAPFLLDILARHSRITAIIGPCEAASSEIFAFGIPLLCLASDNSFAMGPHPGVTWLNVKTTSSRKVAWHLLQMLLERSPAPSTVSLFSGLHTATSIIQNAASLPPGNGHERRDFASLSYADKKVPALMVIIACFILVMFGVYLMFKHRRLPPTWEREVRRFLKSRTRRQSLMWWLTTSQAQVDRAVIDVMAWWNHHTAICFTIQGAENGDSAYVVEPPLDTSLQPDPSHFDGHMTTTARDVQQQQHHLRRRRGGGKKR